MKKKKLKISIITPCLNSDKTLPITLSSIISQTYKNLEHIIVDGGSNDQTKKLIKEYKFKNKKIFFVKKKLYDSINLGIKKATGDIITILNSDDLYNNKNTIKEIVKIINKNDSEIFIGNTAYFDNKNFEKVVRFYNVKKFSRIKMRWGFMPSHSASFVKKKTYNNIGTYDKTMKIAADFDFFLRSIFKHKIKYKIIDKVITRMKTGGISGKELKSYFISTFEILKSYKKNRLKFGFISFFIRLPTKIFQLFNINQIKINKDFKIFIPKIYREYYYDFKLIRNTSKINFKENFVLSALNLAYLGSYFDGAIKYNPYFYHWPDGIYSGKIFKGIVKIPGRTLLVKLKLPKFIRKIIVLGELSEKGKYFLKKKFNIEIIHEKLAYGEPQYIFNKIKNKKFKNDQIIFTTLPTPKQEIIANLLTSINKNFKIICIGGSMNIVTGEEKTVPSYLYNLEWIWRLRYETKRRLLRLLETFRQYNYHKLFTFKFDNLGIKIID